MMCGGYGSRSHKRYLGHRKILFSLGSMAASVVFVLLFVETSITRGGSGSPPDSALSALGSPDGLCPTTCPNTEVRICHPRLFLTVTADSAHLRQPELQYLARGKPPRFAASEFFIPSDKRLQPKDVQELEEAVAEAGGVLDLSDRSKSPPHGGEKDRTLLEENEKHLARGVAEGASGHSGIPEDSELFCCERILDSHNGRNDEQASSDAGRGVLGSMLDALLRPLRRTARPSPPSLGRDRPIRSEALTASDLRLLAIGSPRSKFVPKVALLFLVKNSVPLAPLWEKVLQGYETKYSVYVHTSGPYKLTPGESSLFADNVICSGRVEWGKPSLIDAERRLFANALLDPLNQRFALLSDTCIPVRSFPTIYSYLMQTKHSFVHSVPNPDRYPIELNGTLPLKQFRYGSTWVVLTRKHATMVVKDTFFYAQFARTCIGYPKHVCIVWEGQERCTLHPKLVCFADEHYIQTLLHVMDGQWLSRRPLTWTFWSFPSPHPKAFLAHNTNISLLQNIQEESNCEWNNHHRECYLFARKFSRNSLPALLSMGQDLGLWEE